MTSECEIDRTGSYSSLEGLEFDPDSDDLCGPLPNSTVNHAVSMSCYVPPSHGHFNYLTNGDQRRVVTNDAESSGYSLNSTILQLPPGSSPACSIRSPSDSLASQAVAQSERFIGLNDKPGHLSPESQNLPSIATRRGHSVLQPHSGLSTRNSNAVQQPQSHVDLSMRTLQTIHRPHTESSLRSQHADQRSHTESSLRSQHADYRPHTESTPRSLNADQRLHVNSLVRNTLDDQQPQSQSISSATTIQRTVEHNATLEYQSLNIRPPPVTPRQTQRNSSTARRDSPEMQKEQTDRSLPAHVERRRPNPAPRRINNQRSSKSIAIREVTAATVDSHTSSRLANVNQPVSEQSSGSQTSQLPASGSRSILESSTIPAATAVPRPRPEAGDTRSSLLPNAPSNQGARGPAPNAREDPTSDNSLSLKIEFSDSQSASRLANPGEAAPTPDPQADHGGARRRAPPNNAPDARPKTNREGRNANRTAGNIGELTGDGARPKATPSPDRPANQGGTKKKLALKTREEERKAISACKLLIQKGKLKHKNYRHAEAVTCFNTALDHIVSALGDDHPEVADTHFVIGAIYCKGDYDREAVEELNKALDVYKRIGYSAAENGNKLWRVHDTLGQAYGSLSIEEKSAEHYEIAIKMLTESNRDPPERLHHMRNNLGNAYKQLGRLEEARQSIELARNEMLRLHNRPSESMAKIHSSLGDVYTELGLRDLAIAELEKCVQLREKENPGPEEVLKKSLVTKKLVSLCEATQNKEKAQEYNDKLKQDLTYFMNNKDRRTELLSDTAVSDERAALLHKLGRLLLEIGSRSSTEEALEMHIKCVGMYKQLDGDGSGRRLKIASAYRGLGQGYAELKNYRKSIEAYEAAKALLVEPADADELRAICNNVGNSYEELSDFTKAEENIKAAIRIGEELSAGNPDSSLQVDIAASHNNLGVMYQTWEKYDKSIEHLQKSLRMRQELKNVSRKAANDEASSHHNIGNTYKLMNRIPDALEHYETELRLRSEHGSDSTRVRVALSRIYDQLGDTAKAEKLLEDIEHT